MLKIQGPVHFDNVNENGILKENPKKWSNPNTSGIYVWGFMYKYENGEFIEPIDFSDKEVLDSYYSNNCELPSNWKFLPYYVGRIKDSIFKRIKAHQKVRQGHSTKYIRLSLNYLRRFFKDNSLHAKATNFPIVTRSFDIDKAIAINKEDNNTIIYLNSDRFLNEKYPNCKLTSSGTDYPIINQKDCNGNPLPDTLDEIVNLKNNFWFCYLPIETDKSLTEYETFVYYSLKGKTTSQTQRFSKINNSIIIKNDTDTDIFNVDNNNNLVATNTFSGY